MNRQLALKLVSKMQTNVWDLTDKQAEIIISILENPNQQLSIYDVGKCVLCKNKTENPRINYCDECLENYNGIE